MKYLVFNGKKLLKTALSGEQVGTDDQNLNVLFRQCLLLWPDVCHLPQKQEFCFWLSRTESDTVSLLLQSGSRIQATAAINKLSGSTPKPQLSFTQPGQEQNKKKSPTSWGLFELLRLLFPPFPGLQQASQGGKLAAATAGRSVAAGDHGLWAHGGQSLYLLSCKRTKPGLSEGAEDLQENFQDAQEENHMTFSTPR